MGYDSQDAVVQELRLYIDNDGALYRQKTQPIMENLTRKVKAGKYNPALAPKRWMYLVDEGAARYVKEFGGPGDSVRTMFPKNVREALAVEFARDWEAENKALFDAPRPAKKKRARKVVKPPSLPVTRDALRKMQKRYLSEIEQIKLAERALKGK